jgi:hypothetical protein
MESIHTVSYVIVIWQTNKSQGHALASRAYGLMEGVELQRWGFTSSVVFGLSPAKENPSNVLREADLTLANIAADSEASQHCGSIM